jgi:Glycosyltransferase family 87
MEQRSVITQTTQEAEARKQKETTIKYRLMHLFFTEDVSPDNHPIIELQQRACWIGIALILQGLNELNHVHFIPHPQPYNSLVTFAIMLGSLVAVGMALRPKGLKQRAQGLQSHPRRWQQCALILIFIEAIIGAFLFGYILGMCFLPPQMSNDGTSLDTNAAILLVQGRNPYTDSSIIDLVRRFSIQPGWTTPLRVGQFANQLDYPNTGELHSVFATDLKAGQAPEFESKVSYPALSFLTLVPFALFKDYTVLPFYVVAYLLLVAIALKVARPELRLWVLLLAFANIPMWSSVYGANLDILIILLIVLAWLLRNHRWYSALFFGLALAGKQTSWFLVPFYLIMLGRQYGSKEAVGRMSIAGSIALLINLPFMLWNFHAWLAGVMAPVADPMFPMGVGLVGLSTVHLLPYFPTWFYSGLEAGAMLITIAWYWRLCRQRPEAALLLAVVPLFLAWRSLPSYFYCVAYPIIIFLAARPSTGKAPLRLLQLPTHDKPLPAQPEVIMS